MANSPYLQCPSCFKDLKQPIFLACCHDFCIECIQGFVNKTTCAIICPLCEIENKPQLGGLNKLTSQDTPLGGVEGAKTVPRGVSSTHSGDASIQTGARSQQQSGSQTKTDRTKQNEHILIEMAYSYGLIGYNRLYTHSIGGIVFDLWFKYCENFSDPLTLSIWLSTTNEAINSCDIDYDITVINQEDAECSVRARGKGYVQSARGNQAVEVNLVRYRDATGDRNGFMVKRYVSEDGCEFSLQLDVGIAVSNSKKIMA